MPTPMQPSAATKPLIGCTTYRQETKYTIYGLRPAYVNAVKRAGGVPILIPLGLPAEDLQVIFDRIDGLLLPGGGDIEPAQYRGHGDHETVGGVDPDRDRVEIQIARQAVAKSKPLLAICRGHQVLNVALGGSLWEDVKSQMTPAIPHDFMDDYPRDFPAHDVTIQADSQLARQMGLTTATVNSIHHQGVRDLAPELSAVAHAPDGLIEGVEISGHPYAVGVQWHPEDLADTHPAMQALFNGLVTASQLARL